MRTMGGVEIFEYCNVNYHVCLGFSVTSVIIFILHQLLVVVASRCYYGQEHVFH